MYVCSFGKGVFINIEINSEKVEEMGIRIVFICEYWMKFIWLMLWFK